MNSRVTEGLIDLVEKDQRLQALLVEDNPADVVLFKAALSEVDMPLSIEVVREGPEAWDSIRTSLDRSRSRFDLVILDLNLPGMNGREILERMALDPALGNIPIAVFTTSSMEHPIAEDFPQLKILYAQKTHLFENLKQIVLDFAAFAGQAAQMA